MLYLNISQRIPDQKLKSEIMYFLTELKNFLSTGLHKSRKQFFYFFYLWGFFLVCVWSNKVYSIGQPFFFLLMSQNSKDFLFLTGKKFWCQIVFSNYVQNIKRWSGNKACKSSNLVIFHLVNQNWMVHPYRILIFDCKIFQRMLQIF